MLGASRRSQSGHWNRQPQRGDLAKQPGLKWPSSLPPWCDLRQLAVAEIWPNQFLSCIPRRRLFAALPFSNVPATDKCDTQVPQRCEVLHSLANAVFVVDVDTFH